MHSEEGGLRHADERDLTSTDYTESVSQINALLTGLLSK